jgi:MFS family permease
LKHLPLNVWLLAIAYALIAAVGATVVFVGGLVGSELAPTENLTTLPIAVLTIGTASSVIPVTMLMRKIGRKLSFILIFIFSIFVALNAAYAIRIESFFLFCTSTFLLGITAASIQQFRFAAMESVAEEQYPQAASSVLIGGIAAAYIGPEVALFGINLFETPYVGSFILLAGLFLSGLLILLGFKNPVLITENVSGAVRSLKIISRQRVFWVAILSATVGYAVMSFIMTATPVSMHVVDGHSLAETKWVIQSHILAMFVPSLAAAWLIRKLGLPWMMISGLLAFLLCVITAFISHDVINYWVSLILLGVGWNFLFIGGTTLLPQSYQPNERFKVQALNDFLIFGSNAVAALSAGWLVFALGWELMLLLNLPFIFFLLVFILFWIKKK